MKRSLIITTAAAIALAAYAAPLMAQFSNKPLPPTLVPLPAKMQVAANEAKPFILTGNTPVVAEAAEAAFAAEQLKSWIAPLDLANAFGENHPILFVTSDTDLGKEGYRLSVKETTITITAGDRAGFLYGAQTLRQLLPSKADDPKSGKWEINWLGDGPKSQDYWMIPQLEITDAPRFGWRGMMVDCCRHYFEFDELKKILNMMASLKLNTFHWHLTEDQAWRLEIKKYPELVEKGAWRPGVGFDLPTTSTTHYRESDGMYGGFYTQAQARELVAYAAERSITIVPEIEIPGHAMAFLHVYPQFGCTGKDIPIAMKGGVFPDIICGANEEALKVMEDVLTEVADIFPGTYIHIGGDEAPKTNWKACPKCQAKMVEIGAKNENQLQNWITARMEKHLNAMGKKLIGWDEILEGDNLTPSAAVQVWRPGRRYDAVTHAMQGGHEIVMSPTTHCYLDYLQGDRATEPRGIGGYISFEKVYTFDPLETSVPLHQRHLVKGGQANLWCEFIPNEKHLEYMIAPRIAAIAECVWTPQELRSWPEFRKRMNEQIRRFAGMNFNYRPLDPEDFRDETIIKK